MLVLRGFAQFRGTEFRIWTAPIWIESTTDVFVSAGLRGENTDDPEKTEIDWSEASDYVGNKVTVSGRVVRSFNFGNKVAFFNFDDDYENTLNLIILGSDFDEFGGADGIAKLQKKLINKSVKVKGPISLYRGERVQLRLQKREQILEVTDAPEETRE